MNYFVINTSIIREKKTDIKSDKELYDYLNKNNMAYFYAKYLSEKKDSDRDILIKGRDANIKYIRTLKELYILCKKNNIPFLLFKTFKYIDEPVYNDIDIIVHKKDFHKLLKILTNAGYNCEEDETFKGKCEKKGFNKIEPRVTVSFHNYLVFSEKDIWNNTETIIINGMKIDKTKREMDIVCLLLNILYGPNYCKLYLYKIAIETESGLVKQLTKGLIRKDLNNLVKYLSNEKNLSNKFPLFLSNSFYLGFWFGQILFTNMSFIQKIKHIIFFFYTKYQYKFFNTLYFE